MIESESHWSYGRSFDALTEEQRLTLRSEFCRWEIWEIEAARYLPGWDGNLIMLEFGGES